MGKHSAPGGCAVVITAVVAAIAALTFGLTGHASAAPQGNCPNPAAPGVLYGGTDIVVISVAGPEGGIIHEVHAHTHVVIGDCPPIRGELTYQLQIKVRRGIRFIWISTGTREKKDVSGLPPGTEFNLHSYRHCNPHGKASYRVRLFAAPGINGDGSPSPPEVRYLPVKKGVQKHCR